MKIIIGIDPGKHGALALISLRSFSPYYQLAFSKYTEKQIVDFLSGLKLECDFIGSGLVAYIEHVHSMPRDGVVQAFSFGRNYGTWLGMLTALNIETIEVPPQVWQRSMGLLFRGLEYKDRKRRLKMFARNMCPNLKVTLDTCDALLIARYGQKKELEKQ